MKNLLRLIPAMLLAACSSQASDQKPQEEFKKKIRDSVETVSYQKLTALFDWDDVSKDRREEVNLLWALNFSHDVKDHKHKLKAVNWVSRDQFDTTGLKAISRTKILGKFVVAVDTIEKGKKTSSHTYNLYSGKNTKGEWRLIVTNKDGRIDFGEQDGAEKPATDSKPKSQGKDKPKLESEGRSQ